MAWPSNTGCPPPNQTRRTDTMTTVSTVPTLTLNDGNEIPQLGFGVFQIPPPDTAEAVRTALDVGYRHIDTAEMYRNEAGVGEAIRAAGLSRDEVFITSKLSNACHHPDDARKAFEHTLSALGTEYVNLFLIHWPLPTLYDGDYVSTWKVMEEFKAQGRARSIGVSNFQVPHLERLPPETDWDPPGNLTEAWSPIAQGGVLEDPVITQIADRLERTAAQVVLRWHLQRGSIVFPK